MITTEVRQMRESPGLFCWWTGFQSNWKGAQASVTTHCSLKGCRAVMTTSWDEAWTLGIFHFPVQWMVTSAKRKMTARQTGPWVGRINRGGSFKGVMSSVQQKFWLKIRIEIHWPKKPKPSENPPNQPKSPQNTAREGLKFERRWWEIHLVNLCP